jgi:HEAT repeat protein
MVAYSLLHLQLLIGCARSGAPAQCGAGSAEHDFAANLAARLYDFTIKSRGKLPKDWSELEATVDTSRLDKADVWSNRPWRDRYSLVTDGPMVPDHPLTQRMGQVVAKTRVPIQDAGQSGTGRYVILRFAPGVVGPTETMQPVWIAEMVGIAAPPSLSLEVRNPAARLLPNEPLCAVLTVRLNGGTIDHARFRVEVSAPGVRRRLRLGPEHLLTRPSSAESLWLHFQPAEPGEQYAVLEFAVLFLGDRTGDEIERQVLTADAAEYEVKVVEETSRSESAAVRFTVERGTAADTEAARLFASPRGAEIILGVTDEYDVFEDLVRRYPRCRFAAYASLWLAKSRLDELESLPPTKARQLATELEAQFDRTLGLGFPSIFELRALLYKARCVEARRDSQAQVALWQTIAAKYPGVTGIAELHEVRRRLAAVDEIPQLLARLAHDDVRTRRWVVRRLQWLGHAAVPAIPALIDALRDPDDQVQQEAFSALGVVYQPTTPVGELVARLGSPDVRVRRQAAWELGQCRPRATGAVAPLLVALHDEDAGVRSMAAHAIGLIGPRVCEIAAAVGPALKDPDLFTRRQACFALLNTAQPGDSAALPFLVEALDSDDRAIRRGAVSALWTIGPAAAGAVPKLRQLQNDPEPDIRASALEALQKITGARRTPTSKD